MAEPSGTLMPGAYDDNTTLVGDQIDQRTFVLYEGIDDSVTTITILGSLGDLEIPCYLLFTDGTGEMIFVQGKSGSDLTNCIREVRGTTKAAHVGGASMSLILSGQQLNMFREAVVAGQKFQGLVGLDASKPATPVVNQVYFATDTKKLYVCVTAGVWQWAGNRDDHADLLDLTTEDDHDTGANAYHTDARALTWHGALGTGTTGHVQGGDTHDHGYLSILGAGRVQSGVAAGRSGTPTYEREIYYETDTEFLYVSKGTSGPSDWVKIVGAPVGTIAPFREVDITNEYGGDCPGGWTRYATADGRLIRGAPTGVVSPLNTGGTETHIHTHTDIPQHTHPISVQSAWLAAGNAHSHTIRIQGGGSGSGLKMTDNCTTKSDQVDSAGAHDHTFTVSAHNSNSTKRTSDDASGVSEGTTEEGSSWPPFQEVIWCEKT
jgi:hypothetical protein